MQRNTFIDILFTFMRNFFLLLALFLVGSLKAEPSVLVSIAPQKFLVEKIAGDTVKVDVIVSLGASPHFYEPTPAQTVRIKEGLIWFRMGESFESRLIPHLKKTLIVDQRVSVPLLSSCCHCHSEEAADVHFWLSPTRLKMMATQIESALEERFPENASYYREQLTTLLKEIEELDSEIASILLPLKNKTILVSHPAFGYLASDYGFTQLPIEMEGKEPSPKYLSLIYKQSKEENIRTVFLQKQYNVKAGKKLANDLRAEVVFLDPYAENVIENIKKIAQSFGRS